ncbi:MAG: aminopeptidase P family protein [Bacteroidales bacterium]
MKSPAEKLALIRGALRQKGFNACIITSFDPHLGEYVPDHWRIIRWLTGFTGSAGTVVITDAYAGLWTDSRYFIQAEKQLSGTGFVFTRPDASAEDSYMGFLAENLKTGSKVAIDGRIYPVAHSRRLDKVMAAKNITIDYTADLVSDLWHDRPPIPDQPAFELALEYCGKDRAAKIAEVRARMKVKGINLHLLTSPDDTMWLLNIRGSDVMFTPLLACYALVGEEQVLLFADDNKIPLQLAGEFDRLGIVILPYEETVGIISTFKESFKILINPATTSVTLFKAISSELEIVEDLSIPTRLKAIRNKTEIENIASSMVRDGVALTRFFRWFENNFGSAPISELSAEQKLHEFRSADKEFLGYSFEPIIAFGPNAALPHYSPSEGKGSQIGNGILLVDSGAQYLCGTTDITRTVSTGVPSAKQKKDFTLVLKGHIALAMAKFPAGTRGYQLDILARKALWNEGFNYGHGTGHGVGFCLNVHEGPQSISPSENRTPIEPGMLTSNEPGLYREGEYGIRIENLVLCYEDEESEFGKFLAFDTVSLCYIDKSLIDRSLMTKEELGWLNSYHKEVYDKLSPHLLTEEKEWLKEKTEPI